MITNAYRQNEDNESTEHRYNYDLLIITVATALVPLAFVSMYLGTRLANNFQAQLTEDLIYDWEPRSAEELAFQSFRIPF